VEAKDRNDTTAIFDPSAYIHSQFPSLNAKSVQAYYYIYPFGFIGRFLLPDSTIEEAKKLWDPILDKLATFPGIKSPVIHQYQDYPSYKAWFDGLFGASDELPAGTDIPVNPPTPHGVIPMDSWLIGEKTLTSPDFSNALRDSMPKLEAGMIRGHLTAGGKVSDKANGAPYVNPAWRTALVHIIGTGVGYPNISSIKHLEPSSGSYSNEDLGPLEGSREKNWKQTMWGTNYEPLLNTRSTRIQYSGLPQVSEPMSGRSMMVDCARFSG
jgi:hypothetical protein